MRGFQTFFAYRTEEERDEAVQRYFFEFQPASEWWAHRANSEFARVLAEAYEKADMGALGLSDEGTSAIAESEQQSG